MPEIQIRVLPVDPVNSNRICALDPWISEIVKNAAKARQAPAIRKLFDMLKIESEEDLFKSSGR